MQHGIGATQQNYNMRELNMENVQHGNNVT